MTARVFIGTSGWSYAGWKDSFYSGVPRKDWLRHCARRFTAVEINATFYGLQKKATFRRWSEETPDDFIFCMKANRFLTHNKKLNEPGGPILRERERALGLGKKLAAVVWQLPRNLRKNIDRLQETANQLKNWPEARHVFEFRHPSWFDDEVADCMRRHRLAVCLSDAARWPLWDEVTTDLAYVRLHGHTRTYASAYTDDELAYWAGRIRNWLVEGCEVHVYFDNDAEGAAPNDALRLIALVNQPAGYTGKTHIGT